MIALVTGTVAVRRPDAVVVECGGVGYRLAVSAETLKRVPAVGKTVTLHSHLVVRDDALILYGFASEEERELFLMLLGVQSVGPKVALAVLSGGPPRELLAALYEELDKLSARYRDPLVLSYLEGLSREEVATRLGIPPATVKKQLERGRQKAIRVIRRSTQWPSVEQSDIPGQISVFAAEAVGRP